MELLNTPSPWHKPGDYSIRARPARRKPASSSTEATKEYNSFIDLYRSTVNYIRSVMFSSSSSPTPLPVCRLLYISLRLRKSSEKLNPGRHCSALLTYTNSQSSHHQSLTFPFSPAVWITRCCVNASTPPLDSAPKWFQFYLSGRTEYVSLGRCQSRQLPVSCGVPWSSAPSYSLFTCTHTLFTPSRSCHQQTYGVLSPLC